MKIVKCITALIVCLNITSLSAQRKAQLDISLNGIVSSHDVRPMWLVSNEWGQYQQFGSAESMVSAGASYQLLKNDNFSILGGLRANYSTDLQKGTLQELFIRGKAWFIDYSLGKEQYSPLLYNDRLTSGQFLMSSNARPIPRITVGFFDYLPLGFTKNWLEIKGGMSQGWLQDDRIQKSNAANDLLLHEKFAYVRLGNTKIQPYAGLVHSALYGGTRPNGTEIPIDFWATFTASGSAKLGGGEETNAAGAHMGMWDFGFNWSHQQVDVHFYLQKPFADGSGLYINHGQNKDYILGLTIYPKDLPWLKGLSLETMRTDYQSGEGIPDPLYPEGYEKQGIIWLDEIDDYDQFMYDVFGQETSGWGKDEVKNYLIENENYGHQYGGRDDYMNNISYYNGWTYYGMNMGTSLYHTASKVKKYAESWEEFNQAYYYNNRVNGFHIGAEGCITKQLTYRVKLTYTVNKGSYGEKYRGRSSWEKTEPYFFTESKKQLYSMLEINWQLPIEKNLMLSGLVGVDSGELYNSSGCRFSLIYTPEL